MSARVRPGELGWLAAAVLLVGGLILGAPFVYDDLPYLAYPEVSGPWRGLGPWLFESLPDGIYEPAGLLLHRALYALSGPKPFLYKVSSLALHWANAALLLALLRRWGLGPGAFWAALLFAVFPAHAETLAVSSFKKHMLVAFFGLLLFHALSMRRRGPRLAAAWACQGIALLSRESALMLPLLALVLPGEEGALERLKRDKVLYGGLFLLCVLRVWLLPHPVPYFQQTTLAYHLLSAGKAALWYLSQLAFPADLCPEHDLKPVAGALEGGLVLLGLLVAAEAARRLARRGPLAASAVKITLISLVPFLNLAPHFNLSLVSDRYLYLPALGFFLGVGTALERLRPRAAAAAAAALALAYAGAGMRLLSRYSDPEELWRAACACAPENPRAHSSLGEVLRQRGRHAQALAALEAAEVLSPPRFAVLVRLQRARVLAETGRLEEAVRLARASALERESSLSLNTWGALLLESGRPREALPLLERARALNARHADTAVNLGHALVQTGRPVEAEALWREVLPLPAYRPRALFFLAESLAARGRAAEARPLLEESLTLEPLQADARALLGKLQSRR